MRSPRRCRSRRRPLPSPHCTSPLPAPIVLAWAGVAAARDDGGEGLAALVAIVDDDGSALEAAAGLVRALGFEALAFTSGEALLASDAPARAACVLADVRMPGMSGLQLLRRLAASRPRLPVLLVTAWPDAGERSRALALGAAGYLPKPLRANDLQRCLRPDRNDVEQGDPE